ncbi:uncharacterized protein LOC134203524 [Armigeres subalbatus]|uniref:uncharacterized protein LOC134203524 n=1 Tax=Armigeres subalbatus TaxID=124917 RepID=UPI002ED4DB32
MTLFDPLGLLSTFIIHGKVLIQDIWRKQTEWDEQVSEDVYKKWQKWVKMIQYIAEIRIPRCYFQHASQETYRNSELHVFVDASEVAYSCAIYLRTFSNSGDPQCCLIAAKSKVAPLNSWSVPRLELQGCVLGWVPTHSNPADEATKWGSGPYFNSNSNWFHGPDFLRLPENDWPRSKRSERATTTEMRASVLHHFTFTPVIDFERFSLWDRLLRATAYVRRFLHNTIKKQARYVGRLSQAELQTAERTIFKLVQIDSYPDEIAVLSNRAPNETDQQTIGKQSSIFRLMPMLDNNGLLRERSRIGAVEGVCYEVRHPVILPRGHRVTNLLLHHYHQQYRHCNPETVVNELRQLYTIPRLRLEVRRVSPDCPTCKVRRAKPTIPPMAPLPPARLAHHERAFTYTGVDYFGPLSVKLGRSNDAEVHPPNSSVTTERTEFSQGLSDTFTSTSTKWNFIPPGAPHMGGAWERLVQSVKAAMAEAYSEGKLDDEGLQTLVVEAERMVNSRPLTYLPLESEETGALTPNHFLVLSSNGVKPQREGIIDASRVHQSSELVRREILGRSWELTKRQLDVSGIAG